MDLTKENCELVCVLLLRSHPKYRAPSRFYHLQILCQDCHFRLSIHTCILDRCYQILGLRRTHYPVLEQSRLTYTISRSYISQRGSQRVYSRSFKLSDAHHPSETLENLSCKPRRGNCFEQHIMRRPRPVLSHRGHISMSNSMHVLK